MSLIIPQFSILTDVCAVRVPFHFTRSVDHEICQSHAHGSAWGGIITIGCLLRSAKGTFIGMSESRRGIINGAETVCHATRLGLSLAKH